MTRTENSKRNMIVMTICRFSTLFFEFISRSVMISVLGIEYLGISGLFVNIISLLSLAELGVGSAMIYGLYKPLSEDNRVLIGSYMLIYKKAYRLIGTMMIVLGLLFLPFLPKIISNSESIPQLNLIYLLFLWNSASSYFFSFNQSLLQADQKIYLVKWYTELFKMAKVILQCTVLVITKSYIFFLVLEIINTIITNAVVFYKTNKLYPFLKEKSMPVPLPEQEKKELIRNIFAGFCHNIGGFTVNGVDNLIITAFIGLTTVGIYGNYTLILAGITAFTGILTSSIQGSIGNYMAVEGNEDREGFFLKIDFILYSVALFCAICLLNLSNPFISDLWIRSEEFLFDTSVVFVIIFNYYISGLRRPALLFRDVMGLFYYDRYKPFFEGMVNLMLSLWFVQNIGVVGVILSTILTNIFICLLVEPYVLYTHGFQKKATSYYGLLIYRIITGFILFHVSIYVNSFLVGEGLLFFIMRGILTALVAIFGIVLINMKNIYFKSSVQMILQFIKG